MPLSEYGYPALSDSITDSIMEQTTHYQASIANKPKQCLMLTHVGCKHLVYSALYIGRLLPNFMSYGSTGVHLTLTRTLNNTALHYRLDSSGACARTKGVSFRVGL